MAKNYLKLLLKMEKKNIQKSKNLKKSKKCEKIRKILKKSEKMPFWPRYRRFGLSRENLQKVIKNTCNSKNFKKLTFFDVRLQI